MQNSAQFTVEKIIVHLYMYYKIIFIYKVLSMFLLRPLDIAVTVFGSVFVCVPYVLLCVRIQVVWLELYNLSTDFSITWYKC